MIHATLEGLLSDALYKVRMFAFFAQVSFAPVAMTRRDPRFCCDYFYTSTSRYTMTVITATTTVKLLCKPSTYCFDACEKKGLDKFDKFALDGLFGDKKGGGGGGLGEQISHFRYPAAG